MSRFLTQLHLLALPPALLKVRGVDCQIYVVTSELRYESAAFGVLIVPAGMETDFASVPRIAWAYLDPEDPAILYASVVHDYLYGINGNVGGRPPLTRGECDGVLREAMLASGARRSQAAVVWAAVRSFGGSHWQPAAA